MSISNLGQGQGSVRWNTTPPTLKPALVNGEGWWTGAWIKVPTQQVGAQVALYGYDASASGGNGTFTDGNEQGISYTKSTTTTSNDRRLVFNLRSGSTDVWVASGLAALTTTAAPSRILVGGETLLVIWGVYDSTGSGGWLMFRSIVDSTGTVILNEVQAATGVTIVNTFATSTHHIYDRLIQDVGAANGDTTTGNGRCSTGFAIENVACVKGKFPFAAGVPDATILADLVIGGSGGTSLYTYADSAVLNGGTILSWYKLRSLTDLSNFGSDGSSALVLQTDPGGSVAAGSALAPWNNMSVTELLFDGYVFEGMLGNSAPAIAGTKRAAIASMEAQLELQNGTVVYAWGSGDLTLTSTTWAWAKSAVPYRTDGQDYILKVRNAADTTDVVTAANAFGVGVVAVINDQSQFQRLGDSGKSPNAGSPSAPASNQVRVLYPQNRSAANLAAGVALGARITTASIYGSGYTEMANRIGTDLGASHCPVMLVDVSYTGDAIDAWIADSVATVGAWKLWSEYMAFMLAACKNRITAVIRGCVLETTDVGGLSSALNTLAGLFDTALTNNPASAQMWLVPTVRYGEPEGSTYAYTKMRTEMQARAATGGRWSTLCYCLDVSMDSDQGHHAAIGNSGDQYADATSHKRGNRRFGQKIGRGIARKVQVLTGVTVTLAVDGPLATAAQFTDSGKTAIKVTFDKAVKARDGSTTGLRQIWVTTDNWATKTEVLGAITAASEITITKASGNWLGSTVKVDLFRDAPFETGGGDNGGEGSTGVQALLDKCVYGTDAYNDNIDTGLHAAPLLANALTAQDAASGTTATSGHMSLSLSMGLS